MARTNTNKVQETVNEVEVQETVDVSTTTDESTTTETVEPKKVRKAEIQPTAEQLAAMTAMNTSNKIRYLAKEGYSTPENLYSGIANFLDIRTQHVRNVLNQVLKGMATS